MCNVNNVKSQWAEFCGINNLHQGAIGNVWEPLLIQGSLKGKYRSGHAISDVSAISSENIHTHAISDVYGIPSENIHTEKIYQQ